MTTGEVGTEIAPHVAADPERADRVDAILRQTCDLARAITGAEQAALGLTVADETRKYFSLSEKYKRWRRYRVDPRGLGLHGLKPAPGECIRLTQAEVEAHPAWRAFGDQAPRHPPMRGWLATAVCGLDGHAYGLLQLTDKADGSDFTPEDADRLAELADLTGQVLDALAATSHR